MPVWWHCDITVDEAILTPEPEALEQALIIASHNVAEPDGAVNDLPA